MRSFNTTGPVFPDKHYHILRQKELALLKQHIDSGRFVSAFAPRQTGKTTLLFDLRNMLQEDPHYIFVALDFEIYVDLERNRFYTYLHKNLQREVLRRLQELDAPEYERVAALFESHVMEDHSQMYELFFALGELLPGKRIVLLVDEFEGISFDIAEPMLLTWRSMYIRRELHPALQGYTLLLVGIRNIAQWNPRQSTSPFNIADRLALTGFNEAEIRELYHQFELEQNVQIEDAAFQEIFRLTQGHPYLVNRVGQELAALVPAKNIFTSADIERIVSHELVLEQNDHFDSVKARSARHRNLLLKVLFGWRKITYNPHNQDLAELEMYGIIAIGTENEVRIANPIDEQVILRLFAPIVNGEETFLLIMANQYRSQGLPMDHFLLRFREFVARTGTRLITVYEGYKEAAGQYLLFSYLDYLVKELGGTIHMEAPSGRGRLDLVVEHHGRKFVVETKMWYGPKHLEDGIAQLKRYMRSEQASHGYLVVFDETGIVEDGRIEELVDGPLHINLYYIAL